MTALPCNLYNCFASSSPQKLKLFGDPNKGKQGYLMSKISTIMEKSVLSLVMDTIGIIGMFLVAAVLLCV